jgi:hypothetical protein
MKDRRSFLLLLTLSLTFTCAAGTSARAAVQWHLKLKDGIEEATKTQRPILLVFFGGGTKAHNWFSPSPNAMVTTRTSSTPVMSVEKMLGLYNLVMVKLTPPGRLAMAAGTSSVLAEKFRAAYAKLLKRYQDTAKKYGVLRLPWLVLLSPDGQTVLQSFARKSEQEILKDLRHTEIYFYHYKVAMAMLAGKDPDSVPSKISLAGAPMPFYLNIKHAREAAKKADQPVLATFMNSGQGSYDWFGWQIVVTNKETRFSWTEMTKLKTAGVILAKLSTPTNLKFTSAASSDKIKNMVETIRTMGKKYKKMAQKYQVSRLPTIAAIPPDGQLVFASFVRQSSADVLKQISKIPQLYRDYKKIKALTEE